MVDQFGVPQLCLLAMELADALFNCLHLALINPRALFALVE